MFHVAFKTAALIFYLLSTTLFTDSFVIVFVTCVVLMAFDFWTVKVSFGGSEYGVFPRGWDISPQLGGLGFSPLDFGGSEGGSDSSPEV